MKISEVIATLQQRMEEFGDIDVRVYEDGEYVLSKQVAHTDWRWIGTNEVDPLISIDGV